MYASMFSEFISGFSGIRGEAMLHHVEIKPKLVLVRRESWMASDCLMNVGNF